MEAVEIASKRWLRLALAKQKAGFLKKTPFMKSQLADKQLSFFSPTLSI
jgi:hypothetical protein